MNLEKLKRNFENAYSFCVKKQKEVPTTPTDKLFHWILNTEENPYCYFVQGGHASWTYSVQGLDGLYSQIHHALEDDGELTFVTINGEPMIDFRGPWDFESDKKYCDTLAAEVSTNLHFLPFENEVEVKILEQDVDEFIRLREEYSTRHLRDCFKHEARARGKEFAVDLYRSKPFFKESWIAEVDEYLAQKDPWFTG